MQEILGCLRFINEIFKKNFIVFLKKYVMFTLQFINFGATLINLYFISLLMCIYVHVCVYSLMKFNVSLMNSYKYLQLTFFIALFLFYYYSN